VLCYYRDTDSKKVYLVNVRKAISDRKVHAYHRVFIVWGRKPFDGEVVAEGKTELAETSANGPPPPRPGVTEPTPTCQSESMESPSGV
jgi:hypothetical protein